MAPTRKRKGSSTYCCVVDCHNSQFNTRGLVPPVKFYYFPKKWYETKRRHAWIAAVRRANADGSVWIPSNYSRICSRHFVGNCKSDQSNDPSYVPTIFPPVYYKKRTPSNSEAAQRGLRRRSLGSNSVERVTLQNTPRAMRDQATCMCPCCTLQRDLKLPGRTLPIGTCAGHHQVSSVPLKASRQDHLPTPTYTACQRAPKARWSLVVFMSVTTGADASTQVSHIEHCDKTL